MLAAQFPFPVQPFVESAFTGDNHLERLQRNLLVTFSLVVGVDLLKGLVQDCCEF